MTYTLVALMIVGIIAALFGMKQQKKGAAWGQPLAVVGALLAIGCALKNSISTVMGGNSAASDRELRYQDLQHSFLGNYIKEAVPGVKKVGVMVDSYYIYDNFGEKLAQERENKQLEALKRTISGAEFKTTCVVPKKVDKSKLPKDANGNVIDAAMMMDPMMSSINAKNVKELLNDLKDCDVIIILAAMDSRFNFAAMLKLDEMKGKKLASNTSGNYKALEAAFADKKAKGEMLAVSCSKSSAIYDEKIPGNDQKAYDRRYILITKDNYKDTIKAAQSK